MPDGHPHCLTAERIALQRAERRARDAADEACHLARDRAERLAELLDRHDNDAGDDADAIRALTADIDRVVARVLALLGEPAKARVIRGQIVGLVRS